MANILFIFFSVFGLVAIVYLFKVHDAFALLIFPYVVLFRVYIMIKTGKSSLT